MNGNLSVPLAIITVGNVSLFKKSKTIHAKMQTLASEINYCPLIMCVAASLSSVGRQKACTEGVVLTSGLLAIHQASAAHSE